jgi:hypothetical protein
MVGIWWCLGGAPRHVGGHIYRPRPGRETSSREHDVFGRGREFTMAPSDVPSPLVPVAITSRASILNIERERLICVGPLVAPCDLNGPQPIICPRAEPFGAKQTI